MQTPFIIWSGHRSRAVAARTHQYGSGFHIVFEVDHGPDSLGQSVWKNVEPTDASAIISFLRNMTESMAIKMNIESPELTEESNPKEKV